MNSVPRIRDASSMGGVGQVGVDAELGDRLLDRRRLDSALAGQGAEHGDHHVPGVGLEVPAQGLACVAATHPVGAEGQERAPAHEAQDLLGDDE